ncbi:hypothetical protein [Sutcliffiella cohnii]|uniref:hypothetical protein n=1 Tax=Sutcliffiella cohnii TaxID=33932 RepID=UPI00082C6C64|nr:hypothetical protein [Sutcliffiella cohnii]
MDFDFEKFIKNLKPYEKNKEKEKDKTDCNGFSRVIRHVWLHDNTSSIDFDSFTLSDVENAMDAMDVLPFSYDDGGENFTCDPENPFMQFDSLYDLSVYMNNVLTKQFSMDKDDIFI